jgi:hypothetical protein
MIYMIHPIKQRFYWLGLQQDLFGTWCVHKCYGGLGNKHRRSVLIPFPDKLEASQVLAEIEYLRRQRGYVYADIHDPDQFHLKPQTINEVEKAHHKNLSVELFSE